MWKFCEAPSFSHYLGKNEFQSYIFCWSCAAAFAYIFFETQSKRNVELFRVEILNSLMSLPAVTVKGILINLFIDQLINHHRPLQIGLEDATGRYRQASAIIDRDRKD